VSSEKGKGFTKTGYKLLRGATTDQGKRIGEPEGPVSNTPKKPAKTLRKKEQWKDLPKMNPAVGPKKKNLHPEGEKEKGRRGKYWVKVSTLVKLRGKSPRRGENVYGKKKRPLGGGTS